MSLNIVKKWYNKMPPAERNLPILMIGDKAYSPNQVLSQVKKGTQLGKMMQDKVVGGMTPPQKLEKLAKTRVLAWLKKLPAQYGMVNVEGESYTRDELIAAVRQQKGIGKTLIEEEKELIEERMQI